MQVVDTHIEGSLLASLADALVHEGLGLLVHVLDTGRMDASVCDEVLKRDACRLAADRIEAREHDGLRRVVDDKGDAGNLLEGAYVPALAANDAALKVVRRNMDGRDRDLACLVGSTALDGR